MTDRLGLFRCMIDKTARMSEGSRVVLLLVVSGFCGFCVGGLALPTWQVAVETAQVLAGLVTYPRDNPFYLSHTKLWTVIHQICALFLHCGMSERLLSTLLSGLLGMVSFQALSVVVFVLCGDLLLAMGAPLFISITRSTAFGYIYPVNLLGTCHTYGILGRSFPLLAIALLAGGRYRFGAFCLGLAPSIHPSLGGSMWLVVLITLLWDYRNLRAHARRSAAFFALGGLATAASLTYQMLAIYDVPPLPSGIKARYLTAFVRHWDSHRFPVPIALPSVWFNMASLVICGSWLSQGRLALTAGIRLLLRVLVVYAALGLGAAALSWVPPERVPTALTSLMPTRLLNLNVLTLMALILGLLGSRTDFFLGQVYLL